VLAQLFLGEFALSVWLRLFVFGLAGRWGREAVDKSLERNRVSMRTNLTLGEEHHIREHQYANFVTIIPENVALSDKVTVQLERPLERAIVPLFVCIFQDVTEGQLSIALVHCEAGEGYQPRVLFRIHREKVLKPLWSHHANDHVSEMLAMLNYGGGPRWASTIPCALSGVV